MKFKIRTKLISAFFVMLIPFSLVFIANYFFTKEVHETIHISKDINYELENLGDLQLALDRLLMPANDYIITADPKERVKFDRLAGEVEKHLALITMEKRCQQCHQARTAEMVARLYGRDASKDLPEEMLILKAIRDKFEGIKKYGEEIFSIEKPVGLAVAARLMKEMDALGHKVIDGPISRHRQMKKKDMQKADGASEKAWRWFQLGRTLGYLTALILGVAIALIYSGRFVSVIKVLHKGADSIAGGDLKARFSIKTGDELEQLANAMNGMAAQLDSLYSTLEQKIEERTRELEESEERYHTFFSEARDGIVLIDAESGFIVDCNPEFERQTGRQIKELREMRIWEVRSTEEVGAAKEKFLEIRLRGEDGSENLDFQRPSGEIVSIEFLSKRITMGGRQYLQSFCRDITGRKQNEEKIREQLDYLERFQKVALKREFRIKELTNEIKKLEEKLRKVQG